MRAAPSGTGSAVAANWMVGTGAGVSSCFFRAPTPHKDKACLTGILCSDLEQGGVRCIVVAGRLPHRAAVRGVRERGRYGSVGLVTPPLLRDAVGHAG